MDFLIFLAKILNNVLFLSTLASWLISQVAKLIYYSVKNNKFTFAYLTSSGGFPSSHSATTLGLTAIAAKAYGFDSPYFAIAFFVASVVLYDAVNVRAEAGRHAKILNDLFAKHPELAADACDAAVARGEKLPEGIGHTLQETIVGALIGIGVALVFPVSLFPIINF